MECRKANRPWAMLWPNPRVTVIERSLVPPGEDDLRHQQRIEALETLPEEQLIEAVFEPPPPEVPERLRTNAERVITPTGGSRTLKCARYDPFRLYDEARMDRNWRKDKKARQGTRGPHLDLASVGDENAALRFVQNYGFLGLDGPIGPEKVSDILSEAHEMKATIDLWSLLKGKQPDKRKLLKATLEVQWPITLRRDILKQTGLEETEDLPDVQRFAAVLERAGSIESCPGLERALHEPQDGENLIQEATGTLLKVVNEKIVSSALRTDALDSVGTCMVLLPGSHQGEFELSHHAGTLLQALWLMLAQDIANAPLPPRPCANVKCGIYFYPAVPKGKYCSEECGTQERTRKWRAKAKDKAVQP